MVASSCSVTWEAGICGRAKVRMGAGERGNTKHARGQLPREYNQKDTARLPSRPLAAIHSMESQGALALEDSVLCGAASIGGAASGEWERRQEEGTPMSLPDPHRPHGGSPSSTAAPRGTAPSEAQAQHDTHQTGLSDEGGHPNKAIRPERSEGGSGEEEEGSGEGEERQCGEQGDLFLLLRELSGGLTGCKLHQAAGGKRHPKCKKAA